MPTFPLLPETQESNSRLDVSVGRLTLRKLAIILLAARSSQDNEPFVGVRGAQLKTVSTRRNSTVWLSSPGTLRASLIYRYGTYRIVANASCPEGIHPRILFISVYEYETRHITRVAHCINLSRFPRAKIRVDPIFFYIFLACSADSIFSFRNLHQYIFEAFSIFLPFHLIFSLTVAAQR